jgi:hypothetical protein
MGAAAAGDGAATGMGVGVVPRVAHGGGRAWRVSCGLRWHPLSAPFACDILLMVVEYTIPMVRPGALPLDLGFVTTQGMDNVVVAQPWLNSILAGECPALLLDMCGCKICMLSWWQAKI